MLEAGKDRGSPLRDQLASWLFPIDPEDVRRLVDPNRPLGRDALGELLVDRLSRKSAMIGAATSLPGGALAPVLLGVDARGSWGAVATLAAACHYYDDPSFFDRRDWWRQSLRTAIGAEGDSPLHMGSRAVPKVALERGVRWGARRLLAKVIPFAGTAVGAGWNYAWVRREGARIFGSDPR